MEKMIYNCIQWHIESQHIIPDYQLKFRPDKLCIDSLVILSSGSHKWFINNSLTISAFLDIKGAFDNVIPNILIQDLKNIGIPARVRMFILNLISSRSLHFVVDGNKTGPFLSHKGTPQEFTLSLVLFQKHYKVFTSRFAYSTLCRWYNGLFYFQKSSRSLLFSANFFGPDFCLLEK